MKLYIKRPRSNVDAIAEYDIQSKTFTVLKGSILSKKIAHSEKFRGAKSIEKSRNGNVKQNKLINDITFKSSSTAANFVTGASTNGLIAWTDETGKSFKDILIGLEGKNE